MSAKKSKINSIRYVINCENNRGLRNFIRTVLAYLAENTNKIHVQRSLIEDIGHTPRYGNIYIAHGENNSIIIGNYINLSLRSDTDILIIYHLREFISKMVQVVEK